MGRGTLRAEWFWCDRWMTSSAFLLPLEARGLYREMLTQAWLRGGYLPNDPEAIRRACGVTVPEWRRAWPRVLKYWPVEGDRLSNPTQVEIMETSKALSKARAKAGASGGATTQARRRAKSKPLSPSLSLAETPHTPRKRGDAMLRRFRKNGKPPPGHTAWASYFKDLAMSANCSAEEAERRWVAERETA